MVSGSYVWSKKIIDKIKNWVAKGNTIIAIGTAKINSYLAAILMSTTPLSGSILAHLFTKNEKLSYLKSLGVLIGFSGIILLFFDKVIINS